MNKNKIWFYIVRVFPFFLSFILIALRSLEILNCIWIVTFIPAIIGIILLLIDLVLEEDSK